MDLFDKKGGLGNTVGNHSTSPIPAELSWDNMGAAILRGVEKRKKQRRLLWWWGVGGLSMVVVGIFFLFNPTQPQKIDALPIPLIGTVPISTTENSRQLSKVEVIDHSTVPQVDLENIGKQNLLEKKRNQPALYQQNRISNSGLVHLLSSKMLEESATNKLIDTTEKSDLTTSKKVCPASNDQNTRKRIAPFSSLPILTQKLAIDSLETTIAPITLPLNSKNRKWQLALSGGINWWQYGYQSDEINNPVLPTTLNSWQADVRLSKTITRRLTIKTGLGVQQLRFRSNHTQTETVMIHQPNTLDTVITSVFTGQQTFIYQDSVPGIQIRNFQHFNRHTIFRVPLLLSYQIGHRRWHVSFQTGVALQLIKTTDGKLALPDGTIVSVNAAALYTQKIRWSHLLETEIGYRANQNLTFFARYGLENHFTNWMKNTASYQQQPKVMAVNLGISWRL